MTHGFQKLDQQWSWNCSCRRHNTGMLGHLALEQMPSDLEGPGVDSRFGSAQNMGFFGDNDAMVADLSHMDLAVSQGRIKSEPGVFPSNNSMEFPGGLDGFDPKLSFSSGFGDLTQLPGSEPVDSMFDIPYMDGVLLFSALQIPNFLELYQILSLEHYLMCTGCFHGSILLCLIGTSIVLFSPKWLSQVVNLIQCYGRSLSDSSMLAVTSWKEIQAFKSSWRSAWWLPSGCR